jgi:transposase-like protein
MDKGKIVDDMLRRVGYSYSKLASDLEISRTTLYRKLTEENLSDEFIWKVSHFTRVDFTKVIPDLGPNPFIQLEPEKAETKPVEKPEFKLQEEPDIFNIAYEPKTPYSLQDCKAELVAVQRELIATQKYALTLLQQLHSKPQANG